MIRFVYENHKGEKVDLLSDNVWVFDGTVHGRTWKASVTPYKIGERVDDWTKEAYEIPLELTIRGTRAERLAQMDKMHDVFEIDILNNSPGKLWYGEWYCNCFISQAQYAAGNLPTWISHKVTIYVPSATWWHEEKISIPKKVDSTKIMYPTMYPFRYPINTAVTKIVNSHYTDSDFKMIAYGPFDAVNITIGDNVYKVNYSVLDGEYLVIDSRKDIDPDRRCYVVSATGQIRNVYNYRDGDIFKSIPAGGLNINYNQNYGIDIILYNGRSEPKWNQ